MVQIPQRRRIALALSVAWLVVLPVLIIGNVVARAPLSWGAPVATVIVGWSAVAIAIIGAELARWRIPRLVNISDDDHWFMVQCLFGVAFILCIVAIVI
jgi:hypothetical protein